MERIDRDELRLRFGIAITCAPPWTKAGFVGLREETALNALIERLCDVADGYNHGVFVIEKRSYFREAKPIDADAAKKGP